MFYYPPECLKGKENDNFYIYGLAFIGSMSFGFLMSFCAIRSIDNPFI